MIIILIILVLLSAFFSSAETALTTVNKHKMRSLADDGDKSAKKVLRLTDNMSKMLSAILIGNNIVNISASAIATAYTTDVFGSKFIGASTGILTLVVLIFGEIVPKSWATIYSDGISRIYAYIVEPLVIVLTPVIWLVDKLSSVIFFILRIDKDKAKS